MEEKDWNKVRNGIVIISFTILVILAITTPPFLSLVSGDQVFIVAPTGSMTPTLNAGDVVFIAKSDNYSVGNIIAYNASVIGFPEDGIIHRITQVLSYNNVTLGYATKGDHNQKEDEWIVFPNEVYGKVTLVIPRLDYVEEMLYWYTHSMPSTMNKTS